jgi:hypothetical protein
MYCRNCGTPNADQAVTCVSCHSPLQPVAAQKIENYLVLAIVVTVVCCMPFGIPAIVYAAQVNPKVQGGDIVGAQESSRKARLWAFWGLGIGLSLYVLYAAFFALMMAVGEPK